MYTVNTPEGERFLVQLVGPRSYRMGEQITYRGQTLTVTKRTRDYLVRKTKGAWKDFDPAPPEEIEPVFPPQFGEPNGPMLDMSDLDPAKNPSLTMDQAINLAARTGAVPMSRTPEAPDMDDLRQRPTGGAEGAGDGRGDMTGADLKPGQKAHGGGGSTAKKGGVTIATKQQAPKSAEAATVE